ncbi:MAG: SRPBCC family protein [Nitrospirota bacterium]
MRALLRFAGWTGALAVIVLAAAKLLLEPTYVVSAEVTILAAPEKTWAKVGSLDQWTDWVRGLEQVALVRGDGRTVGSLADVLVSNGFQGWEMSLQLVEVVPDVRLRYQVLGGPQHGVQSVIALTPSNDGRSVRVAWTESHTLNGLWANLMAAVVGSIVTTHHEESLNELKFHLERGL